MLTLILKREYNTWISEYPILLREMDANYGGPNITSKKFYQGRKALFYILEYLSVHKKATCKNIASFEIKRTNSDRKEKSVADDVRKFIQNNLLSRSIVREDGFVKVYNKNEQTYSLTPFGILYAIHLFYNTKESKNMIYNIRIEYENELPKVFKKFERFEKVLGKDFLEIIGLKRIADGDMTPRYLLRGPIAALANFVNDSSGGWMGNPYFWPGRLINQISLCVYNNIVSHLYFESGFKFLRGEGKREELIKESIVEFWNKISEDNPKIKKWYFDYIKEAIEANRDNFKGLKETKDWLK